MLLYRSLQGRIMAALAFVTLFSIISLGLVAFWSERAALQNQLSKELTSSVNYTQQRLKDWLHERQSDVRFLAADSSNQNSFLQLLAQDGAPETKQLHRSLLSASLLSMQQARPEYKRILMANAQGTILVAADPALIGQSIADNPAFPATLKLIPRALDYGYVEDISYDSQLDTYVMCFGYPLLAPTGAVSNSASSRPTALGVVLITVDVQATVYPILTEWRMGESGSAVLSRAEGETTRILNPVRGDEAAPLSRTLPPPPDPQQARPAYWAARGAEGERRTIDHLGVEVLTAYRYIPAIQWGLVLKMDTREVFAPLAGLIRHVLYIALGVLAIALLVSVVIARTLTKPLAELVTTAHAVAAGATPVYTALQRQDEIGILARSLRTMVDTLQRQQQQLKAANAVAGGILGSRSTDEILQDLVQAAQRLTDARSAELTLHDSGDQGNGSDFRQTIFATASDYHTHLKEGTHVVYKSTDCQFDKDDFGGDSDAEESGTIVIPIHSQDYEFGVLRAHKADQRSFTQSDSDTLQALTTYTAVVLENARLVYRLQRLNEELEQKVQERTHKLAEANQQLLVLDKMKSDLLYSISHELRNPLTNIKLQLELLQHHIESPRQEKYLTALVKQVNMLTRLVADMLDLIQIDSMRDQLVFVRLNFNVIVTDIVKSAITLSQPSNKAITVEFDPHATALFVNGSQKYLSLAVNHLLRNAINFTPNGVIRIKLWQETAEACLQIQDTGIGIAESDLPHIFDRFFRGANVSQSAIPGSGLGLSVVEKIISLHGGRLDVSSRLEQGSIFRLWLPLSEVQTMPQLSVAIKETSNLLKIL